MTTSDEWGAGYDAGQGVLLKAVETAELLGAKHERERIIKLLEDAMCKGSLCLGVCWFCQIRAEQIALIKGENK